MILYTINLISTKKNLTQILFNIFKNIKNIVTEIVISCIIIYFNINFQFDNFIQNLFFNLKRQFMK